MQITTVKLQEMVAKAVKGVGNNKLRPLTEMLAIRLSDSKLTITSTDMENYLNISAEMDCFKGDEFYAVIYADQFSKLIARTTSEFVTLTVMGKELKIEGNGNHTVPVILDDATAEMVDYPDPTKDFKRDHKIGTIPTAVLGTILTELKPCVAMSVEHPQFTNFYMGEVIVATDTYQMAVLDTKVFDEPKLISVPTMELLEVLECDDAIHVYESDGKLLFVSDNGTLYASAMPGLDLYPVDRIMERINQNYPSKCKLPKLEVLQLLDRLSLFVEVNDNGAVTIAFGDDGVKIASKQSNSVEVIPYISSEDFKGLQGVIYLDMLRAQVKAQAGDTLEVHFGEVKSIKFVDVVTKVVSIIGLAG